MAPPITLLVAALIAPLAFATAASNNTYGTGGSAPTGWDATVQNFCTTPQVLKCCNGTSTAGAADDPNAATATGCVAAMAGGQVTNEFGFCPLGSNPLCCAVLVAAGVYNGCGPPTQVSEPSSGSSDDNDRIFQSTAEFDSALSLLGLTVHARVDTTVRW